MLIEGVFQAVRDLPAWVVPCLILTGLFAGLLAGMIGVGGGIVIVPVLSHVLASSGMEPDLAVSNAIGTSLLAIVPSAITSTLRHSRYGNVDWSFVSRWGPMIALGSYLGATAVSHGHSLLAIASFAFLCGSFALYLFSGSSGTGFWRSLPKKPAPVIGLGLIIGGWSGAAGVGGGLVSTAMMTACSVPIRLALGTSAAVGVLVSLPGAAASLAASVDAGPNFFGNTAPIYALLMAVAQIPAAHVGARLSAAAPIPLLKALTAIFAGVTSLLMLARLLA